MITNDVESVGFTPLAMQSQRAQAAEEWRSEGVNARWGNLRKLEGRIVQGFRKPVKAEWHDFPLRIPVRINQPSLNWIAYDHDDLEANKTRAPGVYRSR